MKKKIFIAAAVLISNQLKAQQDSTKNLDEVFVTANKFPTKASLTGKVMIVITREQLEKSGGRDLSQVLAEQAGIYVNGANSNPGKDKSVYLRGAKIDHTLIAVDGVPVYDPSGIGSNFDIRLLSIEQIERIEILKGSQSTLYGSDAIAGVINIITRKENKVPLSVAGLFSYGSYNTLHTSASINGNSGKTDYQLGYAYSRSGGINESTDTVTRVHTTDRDGYDQHSLYAAIGFHPSAKTSIRPYLRYTKSKGDIDQGAFTDELDYTYTSGNLQAGMNTEFKIGKGKLNLLYNYSNTSRTYTDDSVKSRNGFAIYSKGKYNGREHFADAYLVYPLTGYMKITTGIDLRRSNSDQSYNSVSVYGPYKTELGSDSLEQQQLGVYAAIVLNTNAGFNAELGGRINHHSAYGNNFVYNFNPSFLLKGQWKFFINISSAYKTPTLYQLYSEYGNKKLDPEKAFTFEGGLQFSSKNNKAGGRITYFNRAVRDAITFFTDPISYQSYYINEDKQKDHGIELESALQLCKTISLKLFYTWLDGRVTVKNNGKDTSYFNLIRRPKSSFGFSVGGQVTPQFYFSSGLTAVGKRTDIVYDAFFNPVQISLKCYALLNVYAEYGIMRNKMRFFTDLHNITGTKYAETYGFNTMGFNASAGIRFNF